MHTHAISFSRSFLISLGILLGIGLSSNIHFSDRVFAECGFNSGKTIVTNVDDCLAGGTNTKYTTNLVNSKDPGDASLSGGGRERIKHFVDRLIAFGMLLAIGGLVMGGAYMASSIGNDQKVKKGKDAVKWSVIGMIVLIFSYPLMNAVINFVYQLGGQ
ncbi:MAG: hypothetical protein U0518_02510 [Candidatus Gracilibacteria bacterium]